ncbi:MAG: hypothetical protein K2L45_09515 [Muribaculaceae bacterium]|nr:hypothetical protein [Muribaculaceae bacterium]
MKLLKSVIALGSISLFPLFSFASKEKEVIGEYTYYIPYNVARDKAEQIAFERARIQAIANVFGTVMTQHSRIDMRASNGNENSDFWSSASSLVKGEWVSTIGEPVFEPFIENGNFAIRCEVKGMAREITAPKAELDVRLLCNGTTDAYESSTFKSGDNCYLAFTTPVQGAIAIYLEDEDGNMFCMLPYYAQTATCTPVSPGIRHLFFTSNDGDEEKYQLTTDKEIERNMLYVVFSQNDFIKPIDKSNGQELSLKTLTAENFRNWLQKSRAFDHTFQVVSIPITITADIE